MSKGTIAALVLLGFIVMTGGFGLLLATLIRMVVWLGMLGVVLAGVIVSLRLIRAAERRAAQPAVKAPPHPASLPPGNQRP